MKQITKFTENLVTVQQKQLALQEENFNLKFQFKRLWNDVSYLMGKENAINLITENWHSENDENLEAKIRNRLVNLFKKIKVQIDST